MLYNFFSKLLTKRWTKIPLIFISFNYKKYKETGEKNSCEMRAHPLIFEDSYIRNTIKSLIDYIRDSYDLEKLP